MKMILRLPRLPTHSLALLLLWTTAIPPRATAAAEPFELKDGDRVLFIGDTFFEREVDYGHIETRLTAAFPDRNITFRNLAWAADTPMGRSRASFDWNKSEDDWLKRVKEQVALVKPTVAFLSYGMTAALEAGGAGGSPAEQAAKIERFKADMNKLMDAIEQVSGQKVRFVLVGIGVLPIDSASTVKQSARSNEAETKVDAVLAELAKSRMTRFLALRDWLPTGANRSGFQRSELAVSGGVCLTELGYRLVAVHFEEMVAPQGKELLAVEDAKAEVLRSAIRKKNELFFHRWRPANWTYLFGFRKHEQGQNAVEIPRFEPLIEGWEKRIAKLRDLKKQDPATVKEVTELTAKSEIQNPKSEIKPQPLPTFDVAEGFDVNLWAENPSLHKPIQMNWDPEGRLWIASSEVYPQIQPGQPATDSIVVLEDTDGDGKADRHTVFADGLLIPTGVAPDGNGGCYVAASHELLHFKDTNGDGKADEKRIVLTSFGTEDTHHNLHTLRWGYDGHLYMNQSIYTHSHVETPHGVVRLNSAGIWRFDPAGYRLEVFTKGGCNPWGHHWDQYGNSFFTDGAGFKGVYHAMEGATYFTYADMRREAESITPGNWPKFCSLELVHSPNFPDDWQGDAITCDFRAHRIVRFKLEENGSTFAGKEMPDLLRTTNVTFRPIDVRFGPDGALYIADWSNPIIQHGEVDFRDPRRDKEHGRIWRVAAKGRPRVKAVELGKLGDAELLEETLSPNGFNQEQARRVLSERAQAGKQSEITATLSQWVGKKKSERAILEGLWLCDSLNVAVPNRLTELVASKDGNIRTAAARILSRWHSLMPNAPELFKGLVADDHPRVRLEALRALAGAPSAKSAELALSVLDKPMDATLDYALWLTINDLAEPWLAAIQSGEWKPEGREKQLEFGLKAIKADQASRVLGRLLETYPLTSDGQGPWIELIGRAGSPKELQKLFDQILRRGFNIPTAARAIAALNEAARLRNVRPASGLDRIDVLLDGPDPIRSEAIRLAGTWKTGGLPKLVSIVENKRTPPSTRQIVFETLRQIGGKPAVEALTSLAASDKDMEIRRQAVAALAAVDLGLAVPQVIEIAKSTTDETQALELWRAVLPVKGASQALRDALPEKSLPEAAAKAGMRSAREGGRDDVDLVVVFAKAGGLAADTQALTGEMIKDLAAKSMAQGDPVRGEWVYRRSELACITCHAIGGAGGKVGPDMTSIGASAPVDYLVESLLLPNAKIKEGYHSVNIETKDGQSLTGTLARETQDEVVLRNAAGAEVTVAKSNIESRQMGTLSLMPGGVLDNLVAQEKLDLIAFLSRLGKPGEFDASKGGVARRWRVYTFTHTDQQHGKGGDIWEKPLTDKMWQPAYSLVSGKLTKAALQEASKREFWVGTLDVFAATEIQVAKAGPVKLKFDAAAGEVWIDGRKVGGAGESKVDLAAGTHRVLVRLDPKSVPDSIRLESPDATFVLN
jgi:putative heme-binding domain-containing protein